MLFASFGDTFQNAFQLPSLRLVCIANPCYTKWRWHCKRKNFITVTLVKSPARTYLEFCDNVMIQPVPQLEPGNLQFLQPSEIGEQI